MCNESGGVVDDTVIYKIAEDDFLVCVNASNREKDFAWICAHNPNPEVTIEDQGDAWVQFAIQGPKGPEVTAVLAEPEILHLKRYHFVEGTFAGVEGCVIARTGYTGEGPLPENPPPLRVVLPGMVYRYEAITARSEIQFTQVEGLAVGHHITFSDLKGTLADFARRMFGPEARVRFRASHFPFTEPSAEVDVECFLCGGKGCNVCKYTGWLEILGAGMVHPVVLRNGGYDPEKYTGFAFGMGPERITMLAHHIEDIRYFWSGDLRFLEQF